MTIALRYSARRTFGPTDLVAASPLSAAKTQVAEAIDLLGLPHGAHELRGLYP